MEYTKPELNQLGMADALVLGGSDPIAEGSLGLPFEASEFEE
jgi:hypothetical protein